MRIIKKHVITIFFGIIMALSLCSSVHALPVFPGAEGFGTDTPAGRGGQVIKVTNLNASGSGSFREAIEALGPRIVVFEVSGTIQIDGYVTIRNPYITIAGQTAPSPGITLKGTSLIVRTHDVLVQHLRFRVGDQGGMVANNRDALAIGNETPTTYNVVIDRCTFSWAIDETISIWYAGTHDITVSNCIVSEALYNSIHPDGPHSSGLIAGPQVENVSVIDNLFAHNYMRNPYIRSKSIVVSNNLIYNNSLWGTMTEDYENAINLSLVGNTYIKGANSGGLCNYALYLYGAFPHANSGDQFYVHDNSCVAAGADDWDAVYDRGFESSVRVNSPPVWPQGFSAMPNSQVKDSVLKNAGARSFDRDAVDDRVINDVRNGTGKIIDSQYDVGGWPNLAQNHRTLTAPANPDGDDDGDGYTNLEEWLHSFDTGTGDVSPVVDDPIDPPLFSVSQETVFSSVSSVTGDTMNWEPLNPDRWAVVSDGDDLRYGIMTSSYSNLTGSRLGEYSLIKNKTYDDFVFEAKVKSTENFTSNISADYCVVFDYQDLNNYYYMMFNAYASNTELFKVVNGTRQLIAEAANLAIPDNAYHVVKIERTGDNIRISFDNTQILEAVDSQFNSGRVGIGGFNDASLWDDITVAEQNAVALPPSKPEGLRIVTQ